MTADIPAWALEEAHRRLKVEGGLSPTFETYTRASVPVRALARCITAHEEPPADPLLVEARMIAGELLAAEGHTGWRSYCERGEYDHTREVRMALAALKRGMGLAK